MCGYTLQGSKSEERIIILHGEGNTGKGTLMDWLSHAFGPDYSCRLEYSSVIKRERNAASASGDIARLEGKRLAIVSEVEKGSSLAESFMKAASGNDAIVARGLYQSEREFKPTHQFIFQTNYQPGFDSTDSGSRRRYIEVPFTNDLSTDPLLTFDGNVKLMMRDDPLFLQAVLNWAVAGAMDWYKNGLQLPPSVVAATAALFLNNDFLGRFLADVCVADPKSYVRLAHLSNAYHNWCARVQENPISGRRFNLAIRDHGYKSDKKREGADTHAVWLGMRLIGPDAHDSLLKNPQLRGTLTPVLN
jgi:putative DNA primase/helicase